MGRLPGYAVNTDNKDKALSMQAFTPTQLHQNPAKVFRAADKDGSVLIKHDRYPDVVFVLTAKEKRS
jgi:hypothetical protein